MPKMLVKGTHQDARSAKGWSDVAPKLDFDRASVFERCGRGAFLKIVKLRRPPRSRLSPGHLSHEFMYPIVARSNGCKPDCRGLLAAKSRAAQLGHRDVVAKAQRVAQRAGCKWARD